MRENFVPWANAVGVPARSANSRIEPEPIVREPFEVSRSAPAESAADESTSYRNVEVPESVVAPTLSDSTLAPGESVPPASTLTLPPAAPRPPSVAPDSTVIAPVAAVWVPWIRSLPADTVVAPE